MNTDRTNKRSTHHTATPYPPEFYEIMVQGLLDSQWGQWFEGMTLSNVENGESGVACTLIAGEVVDQSALHGLLIKIRDLNLKLVSVRRISPPQKINEEISINLTQEDGT